MGEDSADASKTAIMPNRARHDRNHLIGIELCGRRRGSASAAEETPGNAVE